MNEILQNNISTSFDNAACCIFEKIKNHIIKIPKSVKQTAQEIRLRVNKPVVIYCGERSYYLTNEGILTLCKNNETNNNILNIKNSLIFATKEDIIKTFNNICEYSVYSHQSEIKKGFITIKGGHRVGICATAVINDFEITGARDISSLNIRIARQVEGCANKLFVHNKIFDNGILIAGPPSSGKTTILRDIARKLSLNMKKVTIIDERGEIAATYSGIPQNNLGLCDVLDGYPKPQGISQAIRSLSPDIIICDELGSMDEIALIEESLNAGVNLIATIHALDIEELLKRKQVKKILKTNAFKTIVMLQKSTIPGSISRIYDCDEIKNDFKEFNVTGFCVNS